MDAGAQNKPHFTLPLAKIRTPQPDQAEPGKFKSYKVKRKILISFYLPAP
jgi:hypothetical protein